MVPHVASSTVPWSTIGCPPSFLLQHRSTSLRMQLTNPCVNLCVCRALTLPPMPQHCRLSLLRKMLSCRNTILDCLPPPAQHCSMSLLKEMLLALHVAQAKGTASDKKAADGLQRKSVHVHARLGLAEGGRLTGAGQGLDGGVKSLGWGHCKAGSSGAGQGHEVEKGCPGAGQWLGCRGRVTRARQCGWGPGVRQGRWGAPQSRGRAGKEHTSLT